MIFTSVSFTLQEQISPFLSYAQSLISEQNPTSGTYAPLAPVCCLLSLCLIAFVTY